MNRQEEERRARLLKMRAERLPKVKQEYEQKQKAIKDFSKLQDRNFNSNFKAGGKDHNAVKPAKATQNAKKQAKNVSSSSDIKLPVTTARGEMVQHQRMLTQDVNQQASQHIIGVPVNKSRYNGYDGRQVTNGELKKARPDPEAVRIIPMGGVGEPGIGKNMTVVEYKKEMIIIDMGTLFASEDYPGVNYMIPDIKYIEDNKKYVKAILFTHAHLDHIGACRHLLTKFDPLTPIYATEFTIGMIKKQMSELDDAPDLNYIPVNPFDHKIIKVSEHLSVEFIHVLHSIPGATAIIVRTPNGNIYFSGDWRHEEHPVDIQTDYARIDKVVKEEGIDLMFNESTNIDTPGTHPHSEWDVGDSIGKIMDNYANGRVIISCFSSQITRIGLILKEAEKRGRKVALSGFSMVNNVEVAVRSRILNIPKNVLMKMEDIVKLPDEKIIVICTGSQGEVNAVLNRMVTGAHKYIKIKPSDVVVFSSNPIPGNEPKVVGTVDGLLREGSLVVQNGKSNMTDVGPLHLSGHAYYEDHVSFVNRIKPTNYIPYHGEFYMLEHNAEMAENVIGLKKDHILVIDDGDIVEFTKEKKIRKAGRVSVGNLLYDDADREVHDAVVKDRIHISREGIFIIVLTLSRKTGKLIKNPPDIISRAFIYLDDSEDLVAKIRSYLRLKVDKLDPKSEDDKTLKEEIKEDISRILFDATGHTPIVIPVINRI